MSYDTIKKPVISEKATRLNGFSTYAFFVSPRANKITVAREIAVRFSVDVVAVRTISCRAKRVRKGATRGWTTARKKALVTLRAGQKIELA